ncbi:MAG: tetratricopeptide repeat protein [Verrucomicrobia bacterium]|nr:MAG: tetratricopeptide repeat protein [Verrucomicrobiota bacterium]
MLNLCRQTAVVEMDDSPPNQKNELRPNDWLNLEPNLAVGAGIIALLSLIAYWPSLGGGFVWDDLILVAKNPLVTGESSLSNIWFAGDFSLSTVAMWMEWLVFGKNPTGYRVVNLLLHIGSALMIWGILARLDFRAAWFKALIFVLHPTCVASVAWISELKNTLSLPLFLASVWFFLKTETPSAPPSHSTKNPIVAYLTSIACFLLALMAKTSTVMLPVFFLLIAWWQRGRIAKRDVLKSVPHFALAFAFGLMSVWYQTHQAIRAVIPQQENLLERLLTAAMAIWFYLWKIIFPINLSMIYPRWEISSITPLTLLPLFSLVAVAVGLWLARHKRPVARASLFTLAAFVIALFPVLGFFDMYFMIFSRVSDHLAYLPCATLLPLVASAVFLLKNARIRLLVAVMMVCPLLILTFQRAKVFHSDESLWRDTVAKNPNAWNAHNNLACNLAERGQLDDAINHFAVSLELNPKNAGAQQNYAKGLVMKGKFSEAEPHFRAALELKPDDADTHVSYADAFASNRRLAEAIEHYRAALDIKPDVKTRLRLAPLLAATGRTEDAIQEFRAVLKEQPDSVEALNNLAWILATCAEPKLRNGEEAVGYADKAWKLTGGKEATMLGTLGAAYAEAGQFTNAIMAAQQAIELAQASGNSGFARMNQQLQQLYRSGRAYHEKPRTSPATNTTPTR